MADTKTYDLKAIGSNFCIYGDFMRAGRYGSGHINDTFDATYNQAGTPVRYILQRINHNVFKNPVAVMENIQRVTAHLGAKMAGEPDGSRRILTLVPARDGRPYHQDAAGNTWRCYLFVEKATTYDLITDLSQAVKAAAAFGSFQGLLVDLPGRLHETIVNFHNTESRFEALEKAIAADAAGRAKLCQPEIEFALKHKHLASALLDLQRKGLVPERVTHNDTKLNNVMLDDTTGDGICVIDLDTVMPGLALNDFGDMIRTATSPAAEDEQDLSKVTMRMPYFEALVQGYLSTAGKFLNQTEKDNLALSGQILTFECGIRFLADFLAGDVYFKVHKENHNLHRCRTQFKLAADIGAKLDAMNAVVKRLEKK